MLHIVTDIVKLSYCNVWEPISVYNEAPKYRATIVIQKSDTKTLSAIRNAIDEAIVEGREKYGEDFKSDEGIRIPLRDGDATLEPNSYPGAIWQKATSTEAPEIVDQTLNPIQDRKMVQPGDFVRVSMDIFPYAFGGNYGVACRLGNIQLVRRGKHFGRSPTAAKDFGIIKS